MRGVLLLLAVAGLVGVAGCQSSTNTNQPAPVPSNSSPITSLGAASATALRFRPVLQQVAATPPNGTPGGTPGDWQSADPGIQQQALTALDCSPGSQAPLAGKDDPTKPLIACASDGKNKYLLAPAILTGGDIRSVSVTNQQATWVIDLSFRSGRRPGRTTPPATSPSRSRSW